VKVERKTLTPKLRFPEFHRALRWTEISLRSLAAPVTERAKPEDTPHALTLSAEHGIVLQSEYFGKRVAGNDSERYTKIARNDFVYNDRTTQQSIYGTIKRLSAYEGGIVSPIYKCFRFNARENPDFWEWYFASGMHDTALSGLVNEGARAGRFNISPERFLSTTVWRPSNSEQRKIAACLTSLDEWIGAERRKLEALRTHKNGLMQQLFPHGGETRPRLRFPEFRKGREWKGRRIGELLEKVSLPIDVQANNTYREIGVRSHGKGIFYKDQVKGSAIGTKRVFSVVPDALVLNIIFAWEQAVAFTTKAEAGMIASHRFPMFLPKSNACDVRFINLALLTPAGKHMLGVASPGGAGRNRTLGQDEFAKIKIVVPEKDEQARIADLVLGADALIAEESRKLDGLRIHKKGLMQQLFPSPEGV
jgi:type I restriction enzyme, S subunit